ncbi:hypothetical protein [Campylobacter gracilis]|uniref:Uncharacterized protein n=1 Tax=Campylobacter gracilis RM3268 TaxID=553220 RepID=C8PFH9_9BACT|nr:hypothetical protein [Campylobacter gracilis]EEV18445.1 hypothetical protein CAMGR0001_2137 [Campylobacter gracilis RM3268]SUW77840.1 Uncharacterised protein [Campylobacter gracilis]
MGLKDFRKAFRAYRTRVGIDKHTKFSSFAKFVNARKKEMK